MRVNDGDARKLAETLGLLTPVMKQFNERLDEAERRADQAKLAERRPTMCDVNDPRYARPHSANDTALTRSAGDWQNFGDFLQACRFNPADTRLLEIETTRTLSMGTGAAGGFLVPDQFSTALFELATSQATVRPRARVLPADPSAPDAPVDLPVLDMSGVKGLRSGVEVVWTGEGALKAETEPAIRNVQLTPHEVSARVTATDKLLRNALVAAEIVSFLLAEAIRAEEDACFIGGNGIGKPLGYMGHPCSIEITRGTPGAIVFADIENMLMAARAGRSYVWVGSRTILGQLMELTLTGGAGGTAQPIWLPSAREGLPSTLMGLPLLEPEAAPTLGTPGDLALCDFGYYVIKDGFGVEVKASDAPGWEKNTTSIKATWNVDGQPWLSSPIQRADGTVCSPFVLLK